jgi:hypothetical protein
LFLNIAGTTISQGKAVGQLLGQVAVGTLVGAATAGLGTGYALMYAPGGVRDAVYIGAALIDLESAVVNWSNGILLSADPLDVSKISNIRVLNELYFDLMYRSPISMEMEKLNIKRMVQKTKTPVCLIDLTNKEKKFDGLCRGAMLRNPQLVHRSIQEIFNGFLRAAGLYNYHDGVKLSGSLDSIDLSCDMTGAWWDIQLSLSNDHGKTMQVQSRYEFDSFFNGTKSYNQAKDAFGPAVQKLIGEIINDPKFYELIELKAQPERVSTADH